MLDQVSIKSFKWTVLLCSFSFLVWSQWMVTILKSLKKKYSNKKGDIFF